jgi:hypothetical protein
VVVVDVADVSEVRSASIFRVEVCRLVSVCIWNLVLKISGGRAI